MRYIIAFASSNISSCRQKSDTDHAITELPNEFKVGDLVYINRHSPSTGDSSPSAVLDSTIDG